MIENFLRPAQSLAEVGADLLRGIGVLSVVVAAVFFDLTDAGILAFTLPGLFVPRFIGMLSWADITLSTTLLVAAWSNVFDLYTSIPWWDVPVHIVCAGVLAATLYLLLVQLQILAVPGTSRVTFTAGIVLTTSLGLALSALWEMVEWFGYTYITDDIHVTYQDTMADMAAGGLGALCAGFALGFLPLLRPTHMRL